MLQAERSGLPSAKRLKAEAAALEDDEEEAAAAEGDAVDEMDIRGAAAKKVQRSPTLLSSPTPHGGGQQLRDAEACHSLCARLQNEHFKAAHQTPSSRTHRVSTCVCVMQAATREEKLASTLAGREGRGSFSGKRKQKTGGKSNKEKKKNNPFMMARKSHAVRSKVKRRDENNRKKRASQKKQFRGKVRKGA